MDRLKVYVGGLPHNTREQDLEDFFEGFGKLKATIIKNRFAFVEFEDSKHAEEAILEKDGKELLGVHVTVEIARTTTKRRNQSSTSSEDNDNASGGRNNGPLRSEYRVIVQNLSSSVSCQSFKDYMRKAAPVIYADVNRLIPNEGIVEFASYSGMKVAIELDGRRIRLVEVAVTSDDCLSPSGRRRTRAHSTDSDSSHGGSGIESRSITLSPYSARSRSCSSSRSRSRSRTVSVHSDISSDTCFSSRRRCLSVCSDSSNGESHSRSRSRTLSACSDISCDRSWFISRSQSLPGHSISIRSRSRTVSAYTDISRTLSCFRSRSLSAYSDGRYSRSRSRSRTLSADSNDSRTGFRTQSRSPRGAGPPTSSTCVSRNRSRPQSKSRSRSELEIDMLHSESCCLSRPSSFFQSRTGSRPGSAHVTYHESRSESRKKARKRPGSRSHSAIPAKRILLDDFF